MLGGRFKRAVAVFSPPLLLLLIGVWMRAQGVVINMTPSIPGTLIHVTPFAQSRVGDYVSFCRPTQLGRIPKGPCPDGTAPLIKRVIAAPGDVVRFGALGIEVTHPDGTVEWHEMPAITAVNRPVGVCRLGPGERVVRGDHLLSVDSRYFGAIHERYALR